MLTGILAPMPEEIELIIAHMQVDDVYEKGRRKFYKGKIEGKDCIVALSRIGKVASAVTAAVMIDHFKIDRLIVTGVAGGIASEVNIGDVVVASSCVQHDMDARPLWPQFEAPLLDKGFFECEPSLIRHAVNSAQQFLKEEFHQLIQPEDIELFSLQQPKVFEGLLCCGDQFIGTAAQLEKIRTDLPEALCVEMEGGAVGQVCHEYNTPYVVVRTISDSANDHAPMDFGKYINRVSRHYTMGIIQHLIRCAD